MQGALLRDRVRSLATNGDAAVLSIVSAKDAGMAKGFDWADELAFQIRALKLPAPLREFRPCKDRRWRLDCCWPDRLLFVECDGGEWVRGLRRHGGARDCEKWNRLTLEGWAGFRFVGSQIESGAAIAFLERALR